MVETICIMFAGSELYRPGTSYNDLLRRWRKEAWKFPGGSDKAYEISDLFTVNSGT